MPESSSKVGKPAAPKSGLTSGLKAVTAWCSVTVGPLATAVHGVNPVHRASSDEQRRVEQDVRSPSPEPAEHEPEFAVAWRLPELTLDCNFFRRAPDRGGCLSDVPAGAEAATEARERPVAACFRLLLVWAAAPDPHNN